MAARPFGTCFFEQYAQITLSTFLGGEYGILVNRDRPDLQTPETKDIGIEVTRAMEESKTAQQALLKDIAGITPAPQDEELDQIRTRSSGPATPTVSRKGSTSARRNSPTGPWRSL